MGALTLSDGERSAASADAANAAFCVDLDGTLVRTDILFELFFAALKRDPALLLRIAAWALRGRAYLKERLAREAILDVASLPYNETVLSEVTSARNRGQRTYLVTGSPLSVAQQISSHLGLFDNVIATAEGLNLTGRAKQRALVSLFGTAGFDFLARSGSNMPIWGAARQAVLLDPSWTVRRRARRRLESHRTIQSPAAGLSAYFTAIRVRQWIKNVLLFVPLASSHQLLKLGLLGKEVIAFAAFSLGSSAIYLINDLTDLRSDRLHPRKRLRPLASGTVPIAHGAILVPLLLAGAALLALPLPPMFGVYLALYCATSFAYSLEIKNHELLDVLVLAGLWTLRMVAGGAAVETKLSFWLLAFSMFVFMSLALVKRCSELVLMRRLGRERALGRDYRTDDMTLICALGGAAGYTAVLVLALYINSNAVRLLYGRPSVLWGLCPLLLYWFGRVWLKTWRGEMKDDPILFALSDRGSRWMLGLAAVILLLAR